MKKEADLEQRQEELFEILMRKKQIIKTLQSMSTQNVIIIKKAKYANIKENVASTNEYEKQRCEELIQKNEREEKHYKKRGHKLTSSQLLMAGIFTTAMTLCTGYVLIQYLS